MTVISYVFVLFFKAFLLLFMCQELNCSFLLFISLICVVLCKMGLKPILSVGLKTVKKNKKTKNRSSLSGVCDGNHFFTH